MKPGDLAAEVRGAEIHAAFPKRALRAATCVGALLTHCLLAWPAAAVDRFVAPSIQGDGSGSSRANACTLGTALSAAVAGDRIFLADGAYTARRTLAPSQSGTSSSPIEIRGNPANPNAVVVRGFRTGNAIDFIWYRYLRVAGDLHVAAQNSDSALGMRFSRVTVTGKFYGRNLSRFLLDSCRVYPPQVAGGLADNWFALGQGNECPFGNYGYGTDATGGERDTVNACSLYVRQAGTGDCGSGSTHLIMLSGEIGTSMTSTSYLRSLRWSNNQVIVVKKGGQPRPIFFESMVGNDLRDNRWFVYDSTAGVEEWQTRMKWVFRHNKFTRDTFTVRGSAGGMQLSSQGGSDPRWVQGHNKFDQVVFEMDVPTSPTGAGYGVIDWWWGMNADTMVHCVVKSRANGPFPGVGMTNPTVGSVRASDGTNQAASLNSVIDHCTIYSTGNNGGYTYSAALAAGVSGLGILKVRNNIIVSTNATVSTNAAAGVYPAASQPNLQVNNNLYFCAISPPSRSVRLGSSYADVGLTSTWCGSYGQDCQSKSTTSLAAVGFSDAGWASFNPNLVVGSPALFGPDGYVGAKQPLLTGPDITPPAGITNLRQ